MRRMEGFGRGEKENGGDGVAIGSGNRKHFGRNGAFLPKKGLFLEYQSSLDHWESDKERRSGAKVAKQVSPEVDMSEIGGNVA